MNGALIAKYWADEKKKYFWLGEPDYSTVSRATGNIFVSDWFAQKVVCFSPLGEVLYSHSFTGTNKPFDILLDDMDNLLVCVHKPNTVQIIDTNGVNRGNMLTRSRDRLPKSPGHSHTDTQTVFLLLAHTVPISLQCISYQTPNVLLSHIARTSLAMVKAEN